MKVFQITRITDLGCQESHYGVVLGGSLDCATRVAEQLTRKRAEENTFFDLEECVTDFRDSLTESGLSEEIAATLSPTKAHVERERERAFSNAIRREYFVAHTTEVLS